MFMWFVFFFYQNSFYHSKVDYNDNEWQLNRIQCENSHFQWPFFLLFLDDFVLFEIYKTKQMQYWWQPFLNNTWIWRKKTEQNYTHTDSREQCETNERKKKSVKHKAWHKDSEGKRERGRTRNTTGQPEK